MMTTRFVLAAVLATMVSAPACSSEPDDREGDDAPIGDGGDTDTDDGAAGGGDDGGGDDDGGEPVPVVPEACAGAVVELVTPEPSPLAADSSLAVSEGGTVFVAFTGSALTPAGEPIAALFLTQLGDAGWSEPERVPADPERPHATPQLVADRETVHLVWSTWRDDSFTRDIFHATRDPAGQWSEPTNLTAEENQGARTSTAVRDLALSADGTLAIVYGSHDPTDASQREEAPRAFFVRAGQPAPASVAITVGGARCDEATAIHDSGDRLHVVATCRSPQAPEFPWFQFGTAAGPGEAIATSTLEELGGRSTGASLINLDAAQSSLVWQKRHSCDPGQVCGNLTYGLVDDLSFRLDSSELYELNQSDAGAFAPSAANDRAGRITVAFQHVAAGPASDVLVTRSQALGDRFYDVPDFDAPCALSVEPDGDERAPEAVVDPTTGDAHILLHIADGDWVRLAHARLAAAP